MRGIIRTYNSASSYHWNFIVELTSSREQQRHNYTQIIEGWLCEVRDILGPEERRTGNCNAIFDF